MHTLYLNVQNDGICQVPFSEARFPQVRKLVIPIRYARLFVPCCPQVRAMTNMDGCGWTTLSGLFDKSAQTLEELEGLTMSPQCIKCESTSLLRIYWFCTVHTFRLTEFFKQI